MERQDVLPETPKRFDQNVKAFFSGRKDAGKHVILSFRTLCRRAVRPEIGRWNLSVGQIKSFKLRFMVILS
ncbi:MAG TPA: hypothetical protein H9752_06630 [Candidatus Phocaeicola excrementigallinarum]|nr:hypothetical protein [Candidatus Phocaeicola excrementigallinarum]